MKLSEFIKKYYDCSKDITTKSPELDNVYKELILPGTFKDLPDFKKTIAWNMGRDVYYTEVTKENNSSELYVKLTTGKMEFFATFENENYFEDFLTGGLKKHRSYKKENLNFNTPIKYLYFSRRYE